MISRKAVAAAFPQHTAYAHGQIADTLAAALVHPDGIAHHTWSRGLKAGPLSCVALVVGDTIVTGVGDGTKPSDTWPELRPWYRELAKNRKRLQQWAASDERVVIPIEQRPDRSDAPTEAELMAQIIENPDDPAPRLVLADLRMQRGETKPVAGEIAERVESFTFADGFVDSVHMKPAAYHKYGERLFALQPIRELVLRPGNTTAVETIAAAPHLPKLRALALQASGARTCEVSFEPLRGVVLERLTQLALSNITLVDDSLRALAAPRLRSITARPHGVANLLRGLSTHPTLERLELSVPLSTEPIDTLDEIFARLALPQLRHLVMPFGIRGATDEHLAQLVRSAPLLETVELPGGPETFRALTACRGLTSASFHGALPGFDELPWPALVSLKFYRITSMSFGSVIFQTRPDENFARIEKTLLALPSSHPLRSVMVHNGTAYYPLHERFSGV